MKIVKLPIPIKYGEDVFDEVEIAEATSGVIADVAKIANTTGDYFTAVFTFIKGCILSLVSGEKIVNDKQQISAIVRNMPFRSAEYALIQALILGNKDSGVEGVYECPRCKRQFIAQKVEESGEVISDTLDYLDTFDVSYMDHLDYEYDIELSAPVEIKEIDPIQTLRFRYQTIGDCMNAYKKKGMTDRIRLQFSIYMECLLAVNGVQVDVKWKNKYAEYMFNHLKSAKLDLNAIAEKELAYGMKKTVVRTCAACGKEWECPVDTANFFVSALPSL